MSRPNSPCGCHHFRVPLNSANPTIRLRCLLLNTLQESITLPVPRGREILPQSNPHTPKLPPPDSEFLHFDDGEMPITWISQLELGQNSNEAHRVGLHYHADHCGIHVHVGVSKEVVEGLEITYSVWALAKLQDMPREGTTETSAGIQCRWKILFRSPRYAEHVQFSDKVRWDDMLELLLIGGKVLCNHVGESRVLEEQDTARSRLPTERAFRGFPGVHGEMLSRGYRLY